MSAAVMRLTERALPPPSSLEQPWWERARRSQERLVGLLSARWMLAAVCATLPWTTLVSTRLHRALDAKGVILVLGLCSAGSLLGSRGALQRARRAATPHLAEPAAWRRGAWTDGVLFWGYAWVAVAAAMALPIRLSGWHGAAALLLLASAQLWLRGGGLWVAARLGLARPGEDALHQMAKEASEAVGAPLRRVFVLDVPYAAAYANRATQDIWVTRGALIALREEAQLQAILLHEAGHLTEPVAGPLRLAPGPAAVSLLAFLPTVWALSGFAALGQAGVTFWLLSRTGWRERSSELYADEVAGAGDAEAFARALEALHRFNGAPAVDAVEGAHGSLYDRMLAAGLQPDFPRPAPPALKEPTDLGVAMGLLVPIGLQMLWIVGSVVVGVMLG